MEDRRAYGPSGVSLFDGTGSVSRLSDLGFSSSLLNEPSYFPAPAFTTSTASRVVFANNRHGTAAVLDPALTGIDLQLDAHEPPDGAPATPYLFTFAQSGGTGPFDFEVVSGALPPGLALDPSTGELSGLPSPEGMYSFLLRLTDHGQVPPRQDVEDFQMQVLALRMLTGALLEGTCGVPYAQDLVAVGGTPPYTWSASGLPAWATLDAATGRLSGVPDQLSTCSPGVDVTVRDAAAQSVTTTVCITTVASPAPAPIGNELRLTTRAGVVALTWTHPQSPFGFNVYRSDDRGGSWQRVPAGPTLPPSSMTTGYDEVAAPAVPLLYYRVRAIEACGFESTD